MNPSAGQKLKQTRLDKKLSLEQVAQQTHIRIRFLEAIENNAADLLPSPVQAKGFIRLYAGYLGLPAEPILDLWEGKAPPPPVEPIPVISNEIADAEPVIVPDRVSPSSDDRKAQPPITQPNKKSDEFFTEIGRRLRNRREGLGLSLADIERHAHIREHHLLTLEEGRIDDLPSTVQGRGMLVNYSNFLEMEDNDILTLFAEGLQARRVERNETIPLTRANPVSNPPRQAIQLPITIAKNKKSLPIIQLPPKIQAVFTRVKRFITPDLLVGTGLVVVLLGFVIWSVSQLNAPTDSSAYSTDAGIISSETPLAEVGGTETTITGESSQPASTQVAGAPVTATIPAGNGPVQVYIIVKQRAWLQVIVDGSV
ncbi:MAG: helix-turn-helix domain-containing protein, partial [Anaerolineaceae bacterium]|nr:helix-turn-helix domain-containing protein [Anaerolineaceae bacterium]